MLIEILRLDHRKARDARLSTHVALIARALGASRIYYTGERDLSLEDSVSGIGRKWGGKFSIKHVSNATALIVSKKKSLWTIGHLTMYGLPFSREIPRLRKSRKLLLIVGGSKVPGEIYSLADFNISVSNQPHSEAGALAIVLHELRRGRYPSFKGKLRITPSACGKKVVERNISRKR